MDHCSRRTAECISELNSMSKHSHTLASLLKVVAGYLGIVQDVSVADL